MLFALLLAPAPPQDPPTDAQLRVAWNAQTSEDRREIADWFSAECERLDTFQSRLMRFLFRSLQQPRHAWPEAPAELVLYDPQLHAPAQPIERRWLAERSSTVRSWRERVFAGVPERRLRAAWTYDYGTRQVLRSGAPSDPERVFENGLAGFPPDLDLAEALVERLLDDGSQQRVLAAFGHAYADRQGRAYPGVSLYDVWCSGAQLEMPDVECLGIVHDVLGDRRTWVAPVPSSQHAALYAKLGELFQGARRHRGLRTALARAYLSGSPVMRDAYGPTLDRLHGLWERASSDPARMAENLPGRDAWHDWWEEAGKVVDDDPEAWRAGRVRRQTLEQDAARVRALLVSVMREYGALGK